MKQTEFDFEQVVHITENSKESQEHLDKNRKKFGDKVRLVYSWLMAGHRLTVLECAIKGVASLPRRIKDLRESGFRVSDRWQDGIKVYFLTEEDIKFNQEVFKRAA